MKRLRKLMTRRVAILLFAFMVGIALVPALALAVTIKGKATPFAVFYTPAGDSIGVERIAVRRGLLTRSDRYSLYLTLDEAKMDGTFEPLGEQTVPMTDVTLVIWDGPRKRALVEVEWSTGPIAATSDVLACVQVLDHKPNGSTRPFGKEDCEVLTPTF